jgi:predicted transposase/invertase (TIGR01784 family)
MQYALAFWRDMPKNKRVGTNKIVPIRYAPLFIDWTFKKVFGNKGGEPLLMALLNDFLSRALPYKITSIKYLPTEVLGATPGSKKVIFDILCEDESGNAYLVEMQNAKLKNAGDRLRLYIARIQSESLEAGDQSYKLPSAFFIGFLNYERNKSKFYFTEECWFNLQTKEIANKKDFRVFVELPKFDKDISECRSFRDKLIYLFKNLHLMEERPELFKRKIFDRIFEVAEISKLTSDDLKAYRRSMRYVDERKLAIDCAVEEATEVVSAKWYKKGRADGRAKGIEKGRQEVFALLEKGVSLAETKRKLGL